MTLKLRLNLSVKFTHNQFPAVFHSIEVYCPGVLFDLPLFVVFWLSVYELLPEHVNLEDLADESFQLCDLHSLEQLFRHHFALRILALGDELHLDRLLLDSFSAESLRGDV